MSQSPSLASWLDEAQVHLRNAAPDLDGLVTDYVGEARFGAEIIEGDLTALAPDAQVLEVGAGTLLLSCALQAAGYRVTAIEPLGVGFSHMERLRGLVMAYATDRGCVPILRHMTAEALD